MWIFEGRRDPIGLDQNLSVASIIDFLARENSRSKECFLASFRRSLVVVADPCAPASGWQVAGRRPLLVAPAYPARLRVWDEHVSFSPLEKARLLINEVMSSLADGVHLRGGVFSVGSWGVRKKTRSRAGTPDAGGLTFQAIIALRVGISGNTGRMPG